MIFFKAIVNKSNNPELNNFAFALKESYLKKISDYDENDWIKEIRQERKQLLNLEINNFDFKESVMKSCKKEEISIAEFQSKVDVLNYLVELSEDFNIPPKYQINLKRVLDNRLKDIISVMNKDLSFKRIFAGDIKDNNTLNLDNSSEFKL